MVGYIFVIGPAKTFNHFDLHTMSQQTNAIAFFIFHCPAGKLAWRGYRSFVPSGKFGINWTVIEYRSKVNRDVDPVRILSFGRGRRRGEAGWLAPLGR